MVLWGGFSTLPGKITPRGAVARQERYVFTKERGDNGLFITLVPKVLHIINFSFLLTLQLWGLFDLLVY